jgi:putative endonuclease
LLKGEVAERSKAAVLLRRSPFGKNRCGERELGVMPYAYVLKSLKDSRYYYGSTEDVQVRLKSHNAGKVRSTKSRRPMVLVYSEQYSTKSEALKRERFFKSIDGYLWLKKSGIIQ